MEHIRLFILMASFIIPLFLSFQFLISSRGIISRRIMSFTLLNTALIYMCNYFYFQSIYFFYVPIHAIHATLELSIFPSLHLYVKSLIVSKQKLKKEWIHFIPAMLVLIFGSYLFYGYVGSDNLLYFLEKNKEHFKFLHHQYLVLNFARYFDLSLIVLQAVFYGISFFKIPKAYDDLLRNEFSNIEFFSIDWINKYILTFGILTFIGIASYFIFPIYGKSELLIISVFFLLSIFVCMMGIVALDQKSSPIEVSLLNPVSKEVEKMNPVIDARLLTRLNDYLINEKAFLRKDLSLTAIASYLGTNRTYLSSLINRNYEMNFNTYINQLRVDYIINYQLEFPQVSKNELCEIGGFGSISTMQRALNKKSE